MVFYLPILGALALAIGTILERLVLIKKNIDIKSYQVASFLGIVVCLFPFLYFLWRVDLEAFELKNILILLVVVIFSIIANFLVFYSIKGEKINNLEPARVLEPLFVIILAIILGIFFKNLYEQNLKIIIPSLISASALVFSHIKKHHLYFNKYFLAAIAGSFFFALELVISRFILDFYSPVTFYFFRSFLILILSFLIFTPKFRGFNSKTKWIILITGGVWVIYRIIVYYGYIKLGVIFTTLLLMLGPVFIYSFAHFFLNEKMSWKNFLASIIIVVSIAYVII
ncbi:MAG: DMT family transporter [Candidatus Pacearchaeota archaeon]